MGKQLTDHKSHIPQFVCTLFHKIATRADFQRRAFIHLSGSFPSTFADTIRTVSSSSSVKQKIFSLEEEVLLPGELADNSTYLLYLR